MYYTMSTLSRRGPSPTVQFTSIPALGIRGTRSPRNRLVGSNEPDERRMSSIIRDGSAFHGIGVAGRGVFTNDEYGMTYAGQCRGRLDT